MCYQFLSKECTILPPEHTSQCFSNEFSQDYWPESLNGDSFANQSRFDVYACQGTCLIISVKLRMLEFSVVLLLCLIEYVTSVIFLFRNEPPLQSFCQNLHRYRTEH